MMSISKMNWEDIIFGRYTHTLSALQKQTNKYIGTWQYKFGFQYTGFYSQNY